MLTVNEFKARLKKKQHAHWLHVAVDADKRDQFYIVCSGGMGTTVSDPIERYGHDIKACVIDMLTSGELIVEEQQRLLLDIDLIVHYLNVTE